jgi:hypothetical protein
MHALLLVVLTLMALAARCAYVRYQLRSWQRLWCVRTGPVTAELRRRAMLTRLGSDSLEFPQPREFRYLSLRVGGIPVWSWQFIVGLPAGIDARIDGVSATEFDHAFPAKFQLNPAVRTARAVVTA